VRTVQITVGEGRYRVALSASLTGRGLNILLTGGESPHIGAVVMCIPRQSGTGNGLTADTWVVPVPGHKDFHLAKSIGEMISRVTGEVTVVAAGIHIDDAKAWEIDLITQNCTTAGQRLTEQWKD